MYHIFTSKKNKTILATKSHNEAYDFIIKNKDTKVRTLDHNGKTKVIDKRMYLKTYYEETRKYKEFFQLLDFMIVGNTNKYDLINTLDLLEEYRIYKENINLLS